MFAELSMRLPLMLAAAGLLVGLTWWRPMIGWFIYLASVGLDYLLGVAGFSTGGVFSIGQGMLVVLLMVGTLRWYMQGGNLSRPMRGLLFRLAAFVVAVWLSALLGIWPVNSLFQAGVISATVLLPFILYASVDSTKQLRLLMWAIGLGVTLSAAIGWAQYGGMLQTVSREESVSAADTRGVVMEYRSSGSQASTGKRYAGPTSNANGFGLILMGGLPALFYLLRTSRGLVARGIAMGAMGICCFALLLTMSRTHIIGFMLFLALMTLFAPQTSLLKRLMYWALAGVAAAVFLAAIWQLEGVGDRLLAGIKDGGDNSAEARGAVMLGGLRALTAFPLFGIGLNNTEYAGFNDTGNASHDVVSGLLGELGGVGAVAFLLVLWRAFQLVPDSRQVAARGDFDLADAGRVVKAALLVGLVSGFGSKVFDNRAFWIWIGLCAVLHRLNEVAASEAAASTDEILLPEESGAPVMAG